MQVSTDSKEVRELVKLGLSRHGAVLYSFLVSNGAANVLYMSKAMNVLPNALYRLLTDLQEQGLVIKLHGSSRPARYQAVSPGAALPLLVAKKKSELEKLENSAIELLKSRANNTPNTSVQLISSKSATFKEFIKQANKAKKEILVISIGEETGQAVIACIKRAVKRNVQVKLLFHEFNENNQAIAKEWLYFGCEVRHQSDAGYHLMIFDSKVCMLSVNNPERTDERTTTVMSNPSYAEAMRRYFYTTWDSARVITRHTKP